MQKCMIVSKSQFYHIEVEHIVKVSKMFANTLLSPLAFHWKSYITENNIRVLHWLLSFHCQFDKAKFNIKVSVSVQFQFSFSFIFQGDRANTHKCSVFSKQQ